MKTHRLSRELNYVLAMILMPFSISLATKANLGLSMIAAPTYIISEKVSFLTYGQTEYIGQGLMLILMILVVKKFKATYLTSFVTALIYGSILDLFIWLERDWIVEAMWLRVLLFIIGMILTAVSVALFMNTYIAPCAWDYFVRTVVEEKKLNLRKFKLSYDFCFLIVSIALTLILFHKFIGVTWGTLIIAVCNGNIIAFVDRFINKHFELYDAIPKLRRFY